METLSMFRLHAALVLPALSLLVLGLNGQDAETKKEVAKKTATSLIVGSAAPPLTLAKTVKGAEPKAEDRSKTYVVEFWATWCPPCRTSIPHLTELQKKHPKIPFIGVTDEDIKDVEPFVADMGTKMDYIVVLDKNKETNKDWMQAAGEEGIPAAFVVVEGKIAFIGHPMSPEFESTLKQVSMGKFDMAAAIRKGAMQARLKQTQMEAINLIRSGNADAAIKVLDTAISADADSETSLGALKFQILVFAKKEPEAIAYATKMTETFLKNDGEAMNRFAWNFIDPARQKMPPALHVKLASIMAQGADKASDGKNPNFIDTLALAQFLSGKKAEAIKTQERAISLAGSSSKLAEELKKRLEDFKKADKD
jgi:thiol-disulfide isomerase/thioredoxin